MLERKSGKVVASRIDPPRDICPACTFEACVPGEYEGAAVSADERLVALNAPAMAQARQKGEERLGIEVLRPLPHRRGEETALGNLFADRMRQARPDSDVAVLNGGGMRAGLPAGPLTYRSLYESFPFDNGFASLRMQARQLRSLLARGLALGTTQPSLSGLRAAARCRAGDLEVSLTRPDGKPIRDDELLVIITSDYLGTGGDGLFGGAAADIESGLPIREAIAEQLRAARGAIDPDKLLDPKHPRIDLPSPVPVRCGR
jgi:2',3'-cyclic-nucleotide 2'-phosphodiesterase (5'-nucleotidase family)